MALTSVFAGTAWAPKIKTVPEWVITKEECQAGWERIGDRSFDSFAECIRAANEDRKTLLR